MKTRLVKGYKENGMEIVEVVHKTSSYTTSIFKILFSCGHTQNLRGDPFSWRLAQFKRGLATNLCKKCAQTPHICEKWRLENGRAPRKRPPSKTQKASTDFTANNAFNLFNTTKKRTSNGRAKLSTNHRTRQL